MQTVRLNVRPKQNPEKKCEDNIDLDEKIRRIREENKAREKRFKEIEDDKLNALKGDHQHGGEMKDSGGIKGCENTYRRGGCGLVGTGERKVNKGRGQRLLEMSREPLKAKNFQSKAFGESLPEMGKSKGDMSAKDGGQNDKTKKVYTSAEVSRMASQQENDVTKTKKVKQNSKFGRFKIWDKINDCEEQSGDYVKNDVLHKEVHEDNHELGVCPLQEQTMTAQKENVETEAEQTNCKTHYEGKATSISDEGIEICTIDNFSDTVDKEYENITETKNVSGIDNKEHERLSMDNESDKDVAATLVTTEPNSKEINCDVFVEDKNAEKKDSRPKITVNTKMTKTASTSSFDEAISMMSPLDVPSNWGDCDFEGDGYFNKPITF